MILSLKLALTEAKGALRGKCGSSLLGATLLAGCAGTAINPATRPVNVPFAFAVDTNLVETIAPGVNHRFIYSKTGPWAIHILVVDLTGCNSAVAIKGTAGAAGRIKTSTLLGDLRTRDSVVGGVNADFFSLATGVPVGALVTGGRIVTGPHTQPVLAFDSSGRAHTTVLYANGTASIGGQPREIYSWNRPNNAGLAYFDATWGRTMDTATSAIEVVLDGGNPATVVSIDTANAGASIPQAGGVLVAGRAAEPALRSALLGLHRGDTLRVTMSLAPFHPRDAIGGRPMLARDSVIADDIDAERQATFKARNPRTAAGISHDGRRLILVVVDGRQKGYSAGMTLREIAKLMLALGARDAINLDGGGSSTMVYAYPSSSGALRIANSPSDSLPNGQHVERAVGDALAIIRGCGAR